MQAYGRVDYSTWRTKNQAYISVLMIKGLYIGNVAQNRTSEIVQYAIRQQNEKNRKKVEKKC